jgi:hypothetical protein
MDRIFAPGKKSCLGFADPKTAPQGGPAPAGEVREMFPQLNSTFRGHDSEKQCPQIPATAYFKYVFFRKGLKVGS